MPESFDSETANDISGMLSRLGSGPVFVHSDPFRAARLVRPARAKEAFLDSHISLIQAASDARSIWMPTFNYDFPRTKSFDVVYDPSQLGPLTERFRRTAAEWRTEIPIFSAAGKGDAPNVPWHECTDPFGAESIFARLVEADGIILYYGATFQYNTIVHYSERIAGGAPYRYDKLFTGHVTGVNRNTVAGSLNYHVRPLGRELDYDWPGILSRAMNAGACVSSRTHPEVLASSAHGIAQFFVDEMRRDPLALLDDETRRWVDPMLAKLGRGFRLTDFEESESAAAPSAKSGA